MIRIIEKRTDNKEFLKRAIENSDIDDVCEIVGDYLTESEFNLVDNPVIYNLMGKIYSKMCSEDAECVDDRFLGGVVGLENVVRDFVATFCLWKEKNGNCRGMHIDLITGVNVIIKLIMLKYFDMNDEEKEAFVRKVKLMATGEKYYGDIIK